MELKQCNPKAVFINLGSWFHVDDTAIYDAISFRKLLGAVLPFPCQMPQPKY